MRPVTRGAAPRTYTAYGQALDDLVTRLGSYCSYCERRLPTSLAVEHVVPKSLTPELETVWENFLLGCTNCNSVKLAQPTNKRDFLWPDLDNTLAAYTYAAGGFIEVTAGLTATLKRKATKLLVLVGLDRHEASGHPRPAPRDKRWQQRDEVWNAALLCRDRLARLGNSQDARDLVIEAAVAYGFFSVWMTVFAADSPIRQMLIQRFIGTAADCFDAAFNHQPRPGGRL